MPRGKNQHKPSPPEVLIRPHVERFVEMNLSYPAMVEHLKEYYDSSQYSLGLESLKKKARAWGIKRARGQGHTRFSKQGMRDMKNTLQRVEEKIEVFDLHYYFLIDYRKKVLQYMKSHHPQEVASRRRRGGLVWKRFWTAGVNDVWALDQHDKWKRFHLYLHCSMEVYSGTVLWVKIWWTNRNSRRISGWYFDTVEELGVMPLITQSDRGTENNGVANAQTLLRHLHDPSLSDSLQHHWMSKGANIKPEIFWSELHRRWSPGFEELLDYGIDNGLYDPSDILERLVFFYIFIPWLQRELDVFRTRYNTSSKCNDPNKILPKGKPALIFEAPFVYGGEGFGVFVDPAHLAEVRSACAPTDNPVFNMVPPAFHRLAEAAYNQMGHPAVCRENAWAIYLQLLEQVRALEGSPDLQELLTIQAADHLDDIYFYIKMPSGDFTEQPPRTTFTCERP
ncbi:hypothetical protein OBBRIDRAFT_814614 [Obba rivulosa]|uniref:Integrase core domain-containing protein n=1 Tax=Obba rivulosa TaxID=1052685 RepID=A0A8E2ATI6_9APHY|nr:hypothetical protein OBBRIDRAFT_814614 [Obba rivulosa]